MKTKSCIRAPLLFNVNVYGEIESKLLIYAMYHTTGDSILALTSAHTRHNTFEQMDVHGKWWIVQQLTSNQQKPSEKFLVLIHVNGNIVDFNSTRFFPGVHYAK